MIGWWDVQKWRRMALAILLGIVGVALPAAAKDNDPFQIGPRLCELSGRGDLAPEEVLGLSGSFRCGDEAFRQGSDHIWLIADISDLTGAMSKPVLRTRLGHHGDITIHVVLEDGTTRTHTYSGQDITQYWRAPSSVAFPIDERGSARPVKVVIGIDAPWDLLNFTDIAVLDSSVDQARHTHAVVLAAFFCGLLFAPLILNVFFYTFLRRKFILYYIGMIAMLLVYSVLWSGLVFMMMPGFGILTRSVVDHLLLGGIVFSACLLVRDLCEPEKLGPRWRTALIISGAIPFCLGVFFMAMAPRWPFTASYIYHGVFILPFLSMIGALLTASLRGSRFALAQLIGWTPAFIVIAGRIARGLGLIGNMEFFDTGFFPSIMIDVALTAILVTIRVRMLWREKDRALADQVMLRELATTDSLTGLLNRRAFEEHFAQAAAVSLGKEQGLYLLVIDVDFFKSVNDTHGHAVGDRVLVELAGVLQACRGSRQTVSRFGGEEFCMLIEARSIEAARQVADGLRTCVAAHDFAEVGQITVSIGLIRIQPENPAGFPSYYKAADAALYAAKASGRNKLCVSGWMPAAVQLSHARLAEGEEWVVRQKRA
ncbi:MAG: diguanylate cyclase [Hyphomonas sp.]|uniref:sensor domain-containing diguanylate cyclase n=1 Tax=Hyphomonas sp. TaxID=87 RepID=UPI003526DE46